MDTVCDVVKPTITDAMNDVLLLPFTSTDIKQAVFSMDEVKAPGGDGFPTLFYQLY